ncbi:MAG: hypothetical protein HY657_17335 [Acidobacteria bacterium]|nr:hypothetical protein [Acidobacteriota bacterium]
MRVTPRTIVVLAVAAAIVVFCVVQDRLTAAGARRYVALQRAALAGRAPAVTVDEVMGPAVDRSVRQGLLWGAGVLAAGLGLAALQANRRE